MQLLSVEVTLAEPEVMNYGVITLQLYPEDLYSQRRIFDMIDKIFREPVCSKSD